jgi:hypothetical protein
MHHNIDATPESELRKNFITALAVLVVIGCGALLVVSLMDVW